LSYAIKAQFNREFMFCEKLEDFFSQEAPVGRNSVIRLFFEFFIFIFKERYGFFYQAKGEKRFASVVINVIVLCQVR